MNVRLQQLLFCLAAYVTSEAVNATPLEHSVVPGMCYISLAMLLIHDTIELTSDMLHFLIVRI